MKYKIKIIELNNKTRKGTHLYIKSPKKPGRYYKLNNEQEQTDLFLKHYKNKYIYKKGTTNLTTLKKAWHTVRYKKEYKLEKPAQLKKSIQEIKRYIQKIKKKGTITSKIRTGINSITINPTKPQTNTQEKHIRKTLLKGLVIDKKILNLLITDENWNKLQNRLEYYLKGTTTNKEIGLEANTHGKTTRKAIAEAKKIIENQKEQKSKYQTTNNYGWFQQTQIETTKTPTKYTLTIILRKGK